jgi:hypothetical protein
MKIDQIAVRRYCLVVATFDNRYWLCICSGAPWLAKALRPHAGYARLAIFEPKRSVRLNGTPDHEP